MFLAMWDYLRDVEENFDDFHPGNDNAQNQEFLSAQPVKLTLN
jgi:hypothetical protein